MTYKRIVFFKESSYYSMKCLKIIYLLLLANKLTEKIPNLQHYESFLRKKNRKSIKQPEAITYQPKTFENPNITDIKSVITEHPKTSHKLSKTIKKGKKVGSNSSLYSDTKKCESFWTKKP